MKKITLLFLIIICSFSLLSCSGTNSVKYTVTFKQDSCEDIIKEVYAGESLTDIPNPKAILGYDVVWKTTQFDKINGNLIVDAIITPKTFNITYDGGIAKNEINYTIFSQTQAVKYNDTYNLNSPTCTGFEFVCWKNKDTEDVVTDGNYIFADNITIVAVWKIISTDPYWWTPIN